MQVSDQTLRITACFTSPTLVGTLVGTLDGVTDNSTLILLIHISSPSYLVHTTLLYCRPGPNRHARRGNPCNFSTAGLMKNTNVTTPITTHRIFVV